MTPAVFLLRLCLTIACATAGALLAKKLRMPAPFMTGSLLGTLLLGALTGLSLIPAGVKPVVQAVAGAAVGVNLSRSAVSKLRRLALPVFVYVLMLLVVSGISAVWMTLATSLDATTSLLACAPGGIVDMSLLSQDVGGNTPQVALMQMMRLIVALGVFPSITRVFLQRFGNRFASPTPVVPIVTTLIGEKDWRNSFLPTMLVAGAGGLLGTIAGIPAGALTCSMLAVAAFQVKTDRAGLPRKLLPLTQVTAGALAGAGFSAEDLHMAAALLFPLGVVIVEYLFINYIVGPLLARLFRIDLTTMLLACTPAGVSEMALIAGDMGGDQARVAVFQLARLVSVLALYPFWVRVFAGFF